MNIEDLIKILERAERDVDLNEWGSSGKNLIKVAYATLKTAAMYESKQPEKPQEESTKGNFLDAPITGKQLLDILCAVENSSSYDGSADTLISGISTYMKWPEDLKLKMEALQPKSKSHRKNKEEEESIPQKSKSALTRYLEEVDKKLINLGYKPLKDEHLINIVCDLYRLEFTEEQTADFIDDIMNKLEER